MSNLRARSDPRTPVVCSVVSVSVVVCSVGAVSVGAVFPVCVSGGAVSVSLSVCVGGVCGGCGVFGVKPPGFSSASFTALC